MLQKLRSNKEGFTLIELLVVLVIACGRRAPVAPTGAE